MVTFALPHNKLGEEVAAIVVAREGETVEAAEIRAFATERLAPFKVPTKIIMRNENPKGATGKLQRIGQAEKLGLVRCRVCRSTAPALSAAISARNW